MIVHPPALAARRWRSARPWVIASGILLALLLCHESGKDCCAQCGSYRTLGNWGLGIGWDKRPFLVIVPGESIRATRALEDLFPAGHQHDWRVSRHSVGGIPGLLCPIVCFGLNRGQFADAYEESAALRRFVLGELSAGRVTREEVLGMLHLPDRPGRDGDGQAALRARAWGWMKEHAPEATDSFMDGSRYERLPDGSSRLAAPSPPPK